MQRPLAIAALLVLLASGWPGHAQIVRGADEVVETIESPHPYAFAAAPRADGTPIWKHTIHQPEASYIAVHFARLELGPGDELILSDPTGTYRHIYRNRGPRDRGAEGAEGFWGLSILGDTMNIELQSSGSSAAFGVSIDKWAHGFPLEDPETESICGTNEYQDVECYASSYPQEYDKARAAVRLIKNGVWHCTGFLVSCENHIITNEHCVGSQFELDEIEFQFDYKNPSCGANSPSVGLQLGSGTLLDVDAPLDYALILPDLAGNDPQDTYGYMMIDERLPTLDEPIYIPHHPTGDPLRLSIESTHPLDESGRCEVAVLDATACTGASVDDIGYYCDTVGGSSGSPVLSSDTHRVVALHHCGNCPNRGVPMIDVYNSIQSSGNPLPACTTCGPGTAPEGLSATADGDNRIALSWTSVPDALEYEVYRSSTTCGSDLVSLGRTTATSLLDDEATGGVTYHYVVRGINDCGAESPDSNCASETTTGGCADRPMFAGVQSVTNQKLSTCSMQVSWSPGVAQCGTSVSYNVYRSQSAGFTPSAANRIASCVSGTTYDDASVAEGIDYHYIVRAEDDSGEGVGPCGGGHEEENTVMATNAASGPDQMFFADSFETGNGWSLDGEWQRRPPQGLGGTADGGSGPSDPSSAFSGNRVLGVDLNGMGAQPGNYESNIDPPIYATSPVIDLSTAADPRLRFQRWIGVERDRYDNATLEVFDGANWATVWSNPDNNLFDVSWTAQEFDLTSQLAGVSNAQIRFGMDSDSAVHYCGWNLDDVEIFGTGSCQQGVQAGVSPVPNGRWDTGTPMTASEIVGAPNAVNVSWDASTCAAAGYNLFYGPGTGLASYTYSGSQCDLSSSGSDVVTIPDPLPGEFTWWTIAGADGPDESHHGLDSDGASRPASAAGQCNITTQSPGTCN